MKVLRKHAQETDRRIVSSDCHALESRFALHMMDGVIDWEPVVYAFKKTYEWTLHYFTTSEVLDWTWYYPYPEAPLLAFMGFDIHVTNHLFTRIERLSISGRVVQAPGLMGLAPEPWRIIATLFRWVLKTFQP
jgi:hypothetical protein